VRNEPQIRQRHVVRTVYPPVILDHLHKGVVVTEVHDCGTCADRNLHAARATERDENFYAVEFAKRVGIHTRTC